MPGRISPGRTPPPQPGIPPDFLWTFTGGSLAEVNGSGHDATLANGPAMANDRCSNSHSAYTFDGTNDHMTIADSPDFDFGGDDFTVSVWVKKISHKPWGNSVVCKWRNGGQAPGSNEWALSISGQEDGSGPPHFTIESGATHYTAISSTNINLGQWYHLVGMREGDQIRIFLDGAEVGSTYVGDVPVNNVGRDLAVAYLQGPDGPSAFGNMTVDDLAIYRRALSAGEVEQLYEAGCNNANIVVHSPCTITVPDVFTAGEHVYVLIDGVQHQVAVYEGEMDMEQSLSDVADGLTALGLECTVADGMITVPEWPSNWEWNMEEDVAVLNCGGTAENYRWGFQGQIKDDEIHGATGTSYAFEYRMHDARVGRFLSLDPLASKYPWNSPYAFAENSVIRYRDLEGLERGDSPSYWGLNGLVLAVDNDADAEGRIRRDLHLLQNTPPPPDPRLQFQSTATVGVPEQDRIHNAQAVQMAEATGLADGMRVVFGVDQNGEVSTSERVQSAAFLFLPEIAGTFSRQILRGFERLSEVGKTFYKDAAHLAPGERVALFRNTARDVAKANDWTRNSQLSKRYGRDVYTDADKNIYSLDTQHGHFELLDSKGNQQGAIDFNGELMEGRDLKGGHDFKKK